MSKRKDKSKTTKENPVTKASKKNMAHTGELTGLNSMTNWFIVLAFILPLIFSRQTIDPVITVRFIFLGFFMLFFILFFATKKNLPAISWTPLIKIVFYLGLGFAVWCIISLSGAVNPRAGYYEVARNFLNIILLFLAMVMVKDEESKMLKLCKALTVVSLVQSLVGIFQYYDIAFADLPGNFKPYGLMANRNLFGSAQALLFPFSLYVLYKATQTWKWITIFSIIGIIISLIISQTRSAWLATVVMLVVAFILVILFSKTNRKKWAIGYTVGLAVTAGLVFIIIKTDTGETLSKSLKERAASITQPNAASTGQGAENIRDRLKIWDKTYQLIKDHPVTGTGFANWKLNVLKYGSKGMTWEAGFYVPDRPHNVYLQVTAETGIPGAILYFGMWLLIGIIAIKTILHSPSEEKRVLIILMLSGLCAFASDNMFSFPNERLEHTLFITLMAGIILGSYLNLSPEPVSNKKPINRSLLIASLLVIVFNIFIGFKKYSFEQHMNLANAYLGAGNNNNVIEEAKVAKNAWSTVDPEGIPVEVYSSVAYKNLKDFNSALKEALLAKKYNPNSMMTLNNLGTIYTELGQFDKAIENFIRARQLTPRSEAVLKNLGYNYYRVGNYQGCIEALGNANIQGDQYLINLLNDAKSKASINK